jgi:amino acid transporter
MIRGFAIGWTSAIGWLIVLPFEITAAGVTISYWHTYNISIWIAVFIVPLIMIQWFGVKGYGEGKNSVPAGQGGGLQTTDDDT